MPRLPDDYIARATRRSDLHTQGVKGVFLLNGGGVLSLLTFATQLLASGRPVLPLLRAVTIAIGFLIAGLIAAAPINHLRSETSRLYDNEETKRLGRRYGMVHRSLFWASLLFFVIGVATALIGMWRYGASAHAA